MNPNAEICHNRHNKVVFEMTKANFVRMITILLKLSAFDLRELDLLTSGFVCHSRWEAMRSATTRNQAIFVRRPFLLLTLSRL